MLRLTQVRAIPSINIAVALGGVLYAFPVLLQIDPVWRYVKINALAMLFFAALVGVLSYRAMHIEYTKKISWLLISSVGFLSAEWIIEFYRRGTAEFGNYGSSVWVWFVLSIIWLVVNLHYFWRQRYRSN